MCDNSTIPADKSFSLHDMLNGTEIVLPHYKPPERVSIFQLIIPYSINSDGGNFDELQVIHQNFPYEFHKSMKTLMNTNLSIMWYLEK